MIDGSNRRVAKKRNGTLVQAFLYGNGPSPIAELDGSGNVVATFVYGRDQYVPDVMIKAGVSYRLVKDHLSSVRVVVSAATAGAAPSETISYDAWGVANDSISAGFQPFGFAGGLYDRDTGLVRFGTRDYDPSTGRWTTKDPIRFAGGDTNIYAYVKNDPVNKSDPSGLAPFDGGDSLMGGGMTPGVGGRVFDVLKPFYWHPTDVPEGPAVCASGDNPELDRCYSHTGDDVIEWLDYCLTLKGSKRGVCAEHGFSLPNERAHWCYWAFPPAGE